MPRVVPPCEKRREGGRKGENDTKRWRYYDNSLIFKVTKERRDRGGSVAAIWAALIAFYADRSGRSIGDWWKRCSCNVTSAGLRLMKETLARPDEEAGRRCDTLPVNTVIDFIQMNNHRLSLLALFLFSYFAFKRFFFPQHFPIVAFTLRVNLPHPSVD